MNVTVFLKNVTGLSGFLTGFLENLTVFLWLQTFFIRLKWNCATEELCIGRMMNSLTVLSSSMTGKNTILQFTAEHVVIQRIKNA